MLSGCHVEWVSGKKPGKKPRSFHGLITNLVQGGWLTQVRRIAGNRNLLGERGDLAGKGL